MLHQPMEKVKGTMQQLCKRILEMKDVRFAGLIDSYGNLYTGGFREGVAPFENDVRRSLYMKFALETAFRKDFDESLGVFDYSLVQRNKVSILTIPICNYLLLVILEPLNDLPPIVAKIQRMIEDNKTEAILQ
jgi:Family of unknown function (DUF6659)